MIGTRLHQTYTKLNQRVLSTTRSNWFQAEKIVWDSKVKHVPRNISAKPRNWHQALPFSQVPGPKPLPILGNSWRFLPGIGEYYGKDPDMFFRSWRQQYGDLVSIRGLYGIEPYTICFNNDDIEQVYRNDESSTRLITPCVHHYYRARKKHRNPSIIAQVGEDWIRQRSILNKYLMQRRVMENYVPFINEITSDLVDIIKFLSKKDPNNEMPDNFQFELYKWTMESSTAVAYNKRLGFLSLNPNRENFRFINELEEFFVLLFKLDILPSLWKYYSTRNWRKLVRVLDSILEINDKYLQESVANFNSDPNIPENEKNIVQRLYKEHPELASSMAIDIFTGGVDTIGTAMGSILYYLAKNPKQQEILREELRKQMPTKSTDVTKEILYNSPYLKAVIKETLRVSPVSNGIPRKTSTDLVLSGYQIPKGTKIVVMDFIISQDESNYIKSKEFIPERWLRTTTSEISAKNTHPFVTKPFGFGARSCIGQRFANLQLEVGTAKIVRNFKLSWNHPDAVFSNLNSILRKMETPLKVKMEEVQY